MKQLLRCKICNIYTIKESCPNCCLKTSSPKPPKYSLEDKYAKYRRIALTHKRKESGLL